MIKYTILYKNGKTWNGKAKRLLDLARPSKDVVLMWFKSEAGSSIYVPGACSSWAGVPGTFIGKKATRKPNPASVTEKHKAFDKAYAEWADKVLSLVGGGGADTSVKAYKKWLWEQKQAEQYSSDGWIPWGGGKSGKCPLPYNTQVEVKFRCGDTNDTLPAGEWAWGGGKGSHVIVAYRLLGEENKPVKYSEPKKAPIKVTYTFWLGAFGEID